MDTKSQNATELYHFGVTFPRETIQKIDEMKGYYSRNKYILRAVEKVMKEEEENLRPRQLCKEKEKENEVIIQR